MSPQLIQYLAGFSAIYCWLVAGVFLAFSDFVMKSLGAIPSPQGIAAMQSINILVYPSIFMVGLFTLAATSLFFVANGLFNNGSTLLIAAGIIYLNTVMGVSAVGNIPLNNQLAMLDPSSTAAAELWPRYLRHWNTWNHMRTLGAATAALLMTIATFQTG